MKPRRRHLTVIVFIVLHAVIKSVFSLDKETHSRVPLTRWKRQVQPGYRQRQTGSSEISINFINKSGRRLRMFRSTSYGHEIYYRFHLRPNEPRRVLIRPDGSFWVAYDVITNYPMLINGKMRLETYLIAPGTNVDARINSGTLRPHRVVRNRKKLRFIDTHVVVDKSMIDYHGEKNVFNYTLLLMNMVARAFLHRSLGAPVFIAVTDIHLMRKAPSYYRIVPDQPATSVVGACRYARSLDQTKNISADFYLVLTRENIGPAGYASMYTMCTNRSCGLVREKGPDAAFVIAHELAHALGIDHDENDRCPRDNLSGGNLMVKKMYTTSYNYAWSKCSQTMLWQNLRYFKCLSNKPQLLPSFKRIMKFLPGELMNGTEQCKHYHGKAARSCQPKDAAATCRYLWCRPNNYLPCQPVWYHSPLEGTTCTKDRWCLRGRCVKVVRKIPVDGGWSSWSKFKPDCHIRTRQMVVQKRNRTCTNPRPKFSGKKCVGKSEENRVRLPTRGGICRPYALKSLMVNNKVDLRTFRITGCENISRTNTSSWRVYKEHEQRQKVKAMNLTCDFEKSGCQWKSSPRGAKSWNIGRGRTPSANTGPSFDYTFKNKSGNYLYFEASWIAGTKRLEKGDRVVLNSPPILATSVCLHFAYHMYGKSVQALEVYIRNGKHSRRMWQRKGAQGNKWFVANVDLAVNIDYYISIEAVKGDTYHSDIAIDDISVVPGLCTENSPKQTDIKNTCAVVCVNGNHTKMKRQNLPDGYPCKMASSKDNVCFQHKCLPVNCHGVIGGEEC